MSIDRVFRAVIAAAGAATVAACGPRISSDRDETIPVPQGATWAWAAAESAPREGPAPGRDDREVPPPPRYNRRSAVRYDQSPLYGNEILEQRYRRAIEATMQARGFHKAGDASEADFLLSFDLSAVGTAGGRRAMSRATIGVGIGYGGWGSYGMRGYYPWGWGFYRPWGWGLYDPWAACCWYGPPFYGGVVAAPYPMAYREARLIVQLRERSSDHVAWRATYPMDIYEMQHVSQSHVQKVVDRLFGDLR